MRLSVVVYNAQNTDGASEVAQAKSIAEKNIFPQMAPHQKLLLVPGVYGNTPKSCERAGGSGASCSIEAQEVQVVDKLDGFFECVCSLLHARALCRALRLLPERRWAKTDGRVAGFNPWVSAEPIQMQSSSVHLHPALIDLLEIQPLLICWRCKKLRCKSICFASEASKAAAAQHFGHRGAQNGPRNDMALGAVEMPAVLAKLRQMGEYIVAQQINKG